MLTDKNCVVVIGKESVGKSQLVSALTGAYAYSSNFRGATVACEIYRAGDLALVDTPGLVRHADSAAARETLQQLSAHESVLLVAQATHLDDDLRDLLPLAAGKRGTVAVTFWDKLRGQPQAAAKLAQLSRSSGLTFVPLDARAVSEKEKRYLREALAAPAPITRAALPERTGWHIEPRRTWLERRWAGPLLALALLLSPAALAVWTANTGAAWLETPVKALLAPLLARVGEGPELWRGVLAGPYGLATMWPLLFVWALPTVLLYALLLGAYKASGLLDRISAALQPLTRACGLDGRDLARVVMGFGCNVPAVINTRSCASSGRGTCVSAIAFGSACSYQFAATAGVFAAAQRPSLIAPLMAYLLATMLVYARLTAPAGVRSRRELLVLPGRAFLHWPAPSDIWREARGTLDAFFRQALPVFILLTLAASVLDWLGLWQTVAGALRPLMAVFRLPAEAALPLALSAVRKDGILLLAEPAACGALSALQLLTAVYLAGVAVPCLVTTLTAGREMGAKFALRMLGRQLLAAVFFTMLLAWGGWLLGR